MTRFFSFDEAPCPALNLYGLFAFLNFAIADLRKHDSSSFWADFRPLLLFYGWAVTTNVPQNGKRIQGQTTSIRRVGFAAKIQRPKGQNLRKEERRIPEEREGKGEEEEIIIILPFGGERGGECWEGEMEEEEDDK